MNSQVSSLWLNSPASSITLPLHYRSASAVSASPPISSSTIQIVGGRPSGLYANETLKIGTTLEEFDWLNLESSLHYWTTPLRPVQWYPGHIAKTEKELKEQLKLMDVVIEVRDARIPMSTSHPMMDSWLGNRKRILVLNREDMITTADRNAWATYYSNQGIKVVFSNGQLGMVLTGVPLSENSISFIL